MTTPDMPPSLPDPRDDDMVAVLRTAVDETARPLLQLTESPEAAGIVQIRAAFRAAIAPIHQALDQRAKAEPDGDLAGTMRHLHDALDFMGEGNVHSRVARTRQRHTGGASLGRGMTTIAPDHSTNRGSHVQQDPQSHRHHRLPTRNPPVPCAACRGRSRRRARAGPAV